MSLDRHHRLTVYDAAYLQLAVRQVLPLATLDRDLTRAARAEGVGLIGYVKAMAAAAISENADPSTSVGMTKVEGVPKDKHRPGATNGSMPLRKAQSPRW